MLANRILPPPWQTLSLDRSGSIARPQAVLILPVQQSMGIAALHAVLRSSIAAMPARSEIPVARTARLSISASTLLLQQHPPNTLLFAQRRNCWEKYSSY